MTYFLRTLRTASCLLFVFAIAFASIAAPAGASEQAGTARVIGTIDDQNTGLPIADATVQVLRDTEILATAKSDANGQAVFNQLKQGVYHLTFSAPGYEPGQTDDFVALDNQATTIRTVLVRSTGNTTSGLHEIASVTSHRAALQTSSVITQHIAAQKIQQEGLLRIGDALLTLPGFSASDLDSAPGDDLHINIRGLKGSETATLLDGHPIGPIGVGSGSRGGYNYQLSPSWAFNNIQVAYGSGGLALYGTDTLAGAVDFQTIEPTRLPELSLTQAIGSQGRGTSTMIATGSAGRLGYALATGVQGSWGGFKPATFTQTALLAGGNTPSGNPDVSPNTVAANTWNVSGNYELRSSLAKLRYELSPGTNLTLTAYDATSWDDKTGEGDNDYITPEYAGTTFDHIAGGTPGCAGVQVIVDNAGNTSCYNRAQYVGAFSGPYGGTPLAYQGLRNQDYSLRLNAAHGNNGFNAQVWADSFYLLYNRDNSGHTNAYQSFGEEIGDDIVSDTNDFGFGVYGYGQTETDGSFGSSGVATSPQISSSTFNYFIKDQYTPNRRTTFFGSAWLKQDSVTQTTYFNPRATLMFRPTARDVVRVSAGRADGIPGIGLLEGAPVFNQTPANLVGNINCNGVTSVANAANPKLGAERQSDEEISIGHDLGGDSNIQLIAFDMNETNVIFGSVLPLSALGLTAPANLTNGPGGYLQIIGSNCGAPATVANLGVTTNANAGTGRYRGFDITGRLRASRRLFFDYSYDVLSARLFDIPALSLQNNVNLIDGAQIDKVPVHQAALGFDYSNAGWEAKFDGYYVGLNNDLLRPAYTYANAALSKRVKNLTFNLGIYNVFNSQYDQFGRIGYGTFQPENQYGTDSTVLQEAFDGGDGERFGLPQRSFLFSLTIHL
ncbi:MAG TPA: TonB-dependent receptor [Candidatus Baltobacteraceae bacterium]|nr:TonB-dependent receptor [Candidatus Baltobacteraceae bacterium]